MQTNSETWYFEIWAAECHNIVLFEYNKVRNMSCIQMYGFTVIINQPLKLYYSFIDSAVCEVTKYKQLLDCWIVEFYPSQCIEL